jgi:hypothetical protein
MLMKRLMMTYTPMNYNIVTLIRQDPAYKKMSSDNVLGRTVNHKINIQEANNIKNLYNGISTSKKQDIALKVSYGVHNPYDLGAAATYLADVLD